MDQADHCLLGVVSSDLGNRALWAGVTHPPPAPDAAEQQREYEQNQDEANQVQIADNRCKLWGR